MESFFFVGVDVRGYSQNFPGSWRGNFVGSVIGITLININLTKDCTCIYIHGDINS